MFALCNRYKHALCQCCSRLIFHYSIICNAHSAPQNYTNILLNYIASEITVSSDPWKCCLLPGGNEISAMNKKTMKCKPLCSISLAH